MTKNTEKILKMRFTELKHAFYTLNEEVYPDINDFDHPHERLWNETYLAVTDMQKILILRKLPETTINPLRKSAKVDS